MSNRHGTPIWYELMTQNPAAARRFYAEVVGWQIDDEAPAGSAMDYRTIRAADGPIGGVFTLTEQMCQQGAAPCWMMYIGVDDVDRCVAAVASSGGQVLLPAFEIANVGRIALLADPQGAAFYVMRGFSDENSTACDPDRAGHGAWHELHAAHGPEATAFYTAQFAWSKSGGVDMGPMGLYQLFAIDGRDLGGIMTDAEFPRPAWLVYFRVEGIERAAARIEASGGRLVYGPAQVPGGAWIVNGLDPEGVLFALTGTR